MGKRLHILDNWKVWCWWTASYCQWLSW